MELTEDDNRGMEEAKEVRGEVRRVILAGEDSGDVLLKRSQVGSDFALKALLSHREIFWIASWARHFVREQEKSTTLRRHKGTCTNSLERKRMCLAAVRRCEQLGALAASAGGAFWN